MGDSEIQSGLFRIRRGGERGVGKIISDFERMPGYQEFWSKNQSGANKVDLLEKIRRSANRKRILRLAILYL